MSGMLAQAQTKQIGPCAYEVLPLPAGVSLRALTRVLKMAAPAFADVSSLRDAAGAFGEMLSTGLSQLDEDVILYLTAEFSKVTQVLYADGRKVALASAGSSSFDEHFRGRLPDLFAWLRFAAEVTYGPLGEALPKLMPGLMQSISPAKPESATPETPAQPSAAG